MLHILTSDAIIARPDFEPVAISLLETAGSRAVLHLRSRTVTSPALLALAKRLTVASRSSRSTLIINGRVDIALTAGADGVQLGRGALTPTDVRRVAPHLQIGLSIHSTQEAQSATGAPDWLTAGPIYQTATHPGTPGQGITFLKAVVQAAQSPVIAIGGIKPEHLPSILDTGASGVAIASGIWDEYDPNEALIRYLWVYADWASRQDSNADRKRVLTRRPRRDDAG